VDYINNHVWETIKCIGDSLEVDDDDFKNDFFYSPPSSPLKPIFAELEECLVVDYGKRRSCILLDKNLQICDQVLYPQPSWPRRPPRVILKSMEKRQGRLSQMHILSIDGPSRATM
jgi:hypothetical protein